jgi:hypothetical protein
MESTQQKPALVAARLTPNTTTIVWRFVTALFCLQMSFTAYAQLRVPQVADVFTGLGFWGLSYFFWRRLQATSAMKGNVCR